MLDCIVEMVLLAVCINKRQQSAFWREMDLAFSQKQVLETCALNHGYCICLRITLSVDTECQVMNIVV